jgi:hypothetical protein
MTKKHSLEEAWNALNSIEETRENYQPLREAKRNILALLKDAEVVA